MISSQDDRGEGKRTRTHKGNMFRNSTANFVKHGKLYLAELKVIGIVREDLDMVKWFVMRSYEGSEMDF
jgi:hypothetical protein